MRNLLKFLSVLTIAAASSAAQASTMPVSEASYDLCYAKADLHVSLAKVSGYELPTDLAGIWVETMAGCLAEAGYDHAQERADASFCDIVESIVPGSYGLCVSERDERLAERAP